MGGVRSRLRQPTLQLDFGWILGIHQEQAYVLIGVKGIDSLVAFDLA